MKLLKTATLAVSLFGILLVMPHAFSASTPDNNGRGDALPQGIQNNQGLANHGKGDTQGQHNGWTKDEKHETGKPAQTPPSSSTTKK